MFPRAFRVGAAVAHRSEPHDASASSARRYAPVDRGVPWLAAGSALVLAMGIAVASTQHVSSPVAGAGRAVTMSSICPWFSVAIPQLPRACSHSDIASPVESEARRAGASGADAAPLRLLCSDGLASGPRIQVVYAHFGSSPDRLRSMRRSINNIVARANGVFVSSARVQHGYRALRVVQSRCGVPAITDVTLPPAARADFDVTIAALIAQGLNRPDRKYLVFTDATDFCGIGSVYNDDSPGADNLNNGGQSYARVDRRRGCWSGVIAAHEITHMLGAVQLSAPDSTDRNHCTDGFDVMCYRDGSPQARRLTDARCPARYEALLDCGANDYFSVHPRAGSYLATHWNVARSSYLDDDPHVTSAVAPAPVTKLAGSTRLLNVTLTWQLPTSATQIQHIAVRRDNRTVAVLPATATSWVDSAPAVGSSNHYALTVVTAQGLSPDATVDVIVPAIPDVPSGVTLSSTLEAVTLSWSPEPGVTTWTILRDGVALATTDADTTTYEDTDASVATPHSYQITASNISGTSKPSDAVGTVADASSIWDPAQ